MTDLAPAPPHERSRCKARARTGDRCRKYPVPGGVVCRLHGGAAPQVEAAAEARLLDTSARRLLAGREISPVTDVQTELLLVAGEAREWLTILRELVDVANLRYRAGTGEHIRGEVVLYERAMERQERFLVDLQRLGLEERHQKLSEQTGQMLFAVMRRLVERLGHSPDDPEVRVIAAEVVREITAG